MIRARAGTKRSPRLFSFASAPGSLFLVLAAAAILLGACGTSTPASNGPPASSATETAPPSVAHSSPAESPGAATESPEPSATNPTSEPESTPSPAPSGTVSAAQGCSGSPSVREFFSIFAQSVDWPVYCAVARDEWSFESGTYRLANGGRLVASYKGPSGAHIQFQEGAFCNTSDGCVPSGSDLGPAPFGDQDGTLVALDGGGLALVVNRGSKVSWLAIGGNVDDDTFKAICANVRRIGQ